MTDESAIHSLVTVRPRAQGVPEPEAKPRERENDPTIEVKGLRGRSRCLE